MSTKRDQIRAAALKSEAPKSKVVNVDGVDYEVRAPSVRIADTIRKRATKGSEVDGVALAINAVIECTYAPQDADEKARGEPAERVFEESDFDALAEKPAGGLVDVLGMTAIELLSKASPEAAKNG